MLNSQERPLGFTPVAALQTEARAAFISKTYYHLLGAILAFTGLEFLYFSTGFAERVAVGLLSTSWLLVLGGFVLFSWVASHFAHTAQSKPAQYSGLGLYIFLESIIFVPLLWIADQYAPGAIKSAATVTLLGFLGLTGIAFMSRKDFSFLRTFLVWGGIIAILAIVGGAVFGFTLGIGFSVAMVALAGAAILYDTSKVIHHFPEDRYVGAAMELFASVALLFWYVLRIFIASRD